jgi:hypothetical protein
MKQRADLDTDVPCPVCGKRFTLGGPLDFQWGKTPHSYRDRVVWLKNRAGEVVPPFQLVGPDDLWNCGEPTYTDLYVFDSNPNISEFTCSHCDTGDGISCIWAGSPRRSCCCTERWRCNTRPSAGGRRRPCTPCRRSWRCR